MIKTREKPGLNQKKSMAYLKNQKTQKTWFEAKKTQVFLGFLIPFTMLSNNNKYTYDHLINTLP